MPKSTGKAKIGKVKTRKELGKSYPSSGLASEILVNSEDSLWLPSRILAWNHQLGGGLLYGKIMELFGEESSGKSLLSIDFGVVAQSLGGVVIWADSEFSMSANWAKQNGLKLDKLEIYPETSIEKISDWIADLVYYHRRILTHNEPILVVVDSLAALECNDNLNTVQQDRKAEMGNRAKAIGIFLRTRNPLFAQLGVCVICINQLRSKIGASKFENPDCLHYGTMVPFVDGRSFPIGEIVKNHIKGDVWSYNERSGKFEPKPITHWVQKEKLAGDESWLCITTRGPGTKNGVFEITCTEKHGILTQRGWVNAKDIVIEDMVISKYAHRKGGSLQDFLYGSFIGDSALHLRAKGTANYQLRDNGNPQYLSWKLSLLAPFIRMEYSEIALRAGHGKWQSPYSVELAIHAKRFINRDPLVLGLDLLNPLTLAIWWMDDGHLTLRKNLRGIISISHKRTDIAGLVRLLCMAGYSCTPRGNKGILFDTPGLDNLHRAISNYIPECMQHKLLSKYRGQYIPLELTSGEVELDSLPTEVISIRRAGQMAYRKPYKYDLTILDNHNFLAGNKDNGFVVHNTTPGGQAMKFFADIRTGVYGGKQIVKKLFGIEEKVGRYVSIRVIKNKLAPPRATLKAMEAYFNPDFTTPGFGRYINLPDALIKTGTVTKRGSRFYLGDTMLANGDEAMVKLLKKDEKIRKELLLKSGINTISKTRQQLKALTTNLYPIRESPKKEEDDDDE